MKIFKYIFTLIAIVTTINASAQVYPVQVTVATTPPYYNYLSHYGDQNNHLLIVATLTDFNSPPVNVRLRLKIEGSGYTLRTRQDIPIGNVYTLSPGVPVFIQGDELLPLLTEQNLAVVSGSPNLNNLPEGITTICVEVVENGTGGAVLATQNCSSFLLQLMQPPQPFLPVCNSVVDTTSMFQTFQWSQPQNYIPSIGSELNYTFSLYEWIDTTNYNIFQTGQGLVYTAQTTSPIVQVSNFDVAFQKGRKYVWRVRAQLSSNGLPTQMITQNGLSQPCSFYYGKPVTISEALADGLSINLSTQALTTRKGQAIWTVTDATPGQGLSTYSSYIVEYRKKTPEGSSIIYPWSVDTVASLMLPIYQLEPEQTYQVRVAGMSGGYTSDRTPISEFTTPSARVYACGESDLPFMPGNYEPLPILHMGDVVQIGQFQLNVTQATALGTPGRFSGHGEIPHDFLAGAKVKVRFDNLLIDKEYIVREGVANAMTDGAEGWMNDYYLDHAFRDTVGFVTAYGYSGDSTSIFVVVGEDTLTYTFNLPYPIVIYGEGNVAYQFWPDGTVVITTWGTTPSADQLDATKNLFARFETVEGSEQLFDKKKYDHLAANYEVIACVENFNYWVPNTAKGTSGTTQVKATVHVNTPGYVPTNMSFVLKGGYTTVQHTQVNDTTFILTLPAKSFDYQVYAMYEEFKIGKLNVSSFDAVTRKVKIVPLVAMNGITAQAITNGLNTQFTAANTAFDIEIDTLFNSPEFNAQTVFNNPDVTLMSKYTDQMRELRLAYLASNDLANDEYLVFVIPGFENAGIDGYMVRGRALGFITQSNLSSTGVFISTLSHELGHGIGGLQHTWGDDLTKKGATDNLMDYSSLAPKTLTRLQWEDVHNASLTLNLFDSEEDGMGLNLAFRNLTLPPYCNHIVSINKSKFNDISKVVFQSVEGTIFKFRESSLSNLQYVNLCSGLVVSVTGVDDEEFKRITISYKNMDGDLEVPNLLFDHPTKPNVAEKCYKDDGTYVDCYYPTSDDILVDAPKCENIEKIFIGPSKVTNEMVDANPNNFKAYTKNCNDGKTCVADNFTTVSEQFKTEIKNYVLQLADLNTYYSNTGKTFVTRKSEGSSYERMISLDQEKILDEKLNQLHYLRPNLTVCFIAYETDQPNMIYSGTQLNEVAQYAIDQASIQYPDKEFAVFIINMEKDEYHGQYGVEVTECQEFGYAIKSSRGLLDFAITTAELKDFKYISGEFLKIYTLLKKPYKISNVYERYDGSIVTREIDRLNNSATDKCGLPSIYNGHVLVSKNQNNYFEKRMNLSIAYDAFNETYELNHNGYGNNQDAEREQRIQEITQLTNEIRLLEYQYDAESENDLTNPELWYRDYEMDKTLSNVIDHYIDVDRVIFELNKRRGNEYLTNIEQYLGISESSVGSNTYYEFDAVTVLLDPLIYGALDVVGCIPGVDYVTDALGVAYATVRGDGDQILIYSAALATPFVGAIVYKQGKKLVGLYIKKTAPDVYSIAVKEAGDDLTDWYRVSNEIPVDPSDVSLIKNEINNSSKLSDLPNSKRKSMYDAVKGVDNLLTRRNNWLNNLKSQYNVNDAFSPQGLNPSNISPTLKNEMLNGFSSALPNNLKENFFNTLIQSGSTVPIKQTYNAGDELYKIVPKGNGYSKSSFYMSKTEFDALKNSTDIEQKLGLPLGSHAVEYDVYKATANQSVDVFESTVANTVQGGYTTTGGAKQTFLLDDSKWTITLETNSLIPPK